MAAASRSVHRCDPAGCRGLGEGQPGGLLLPRLWGQHQRTVRPDWDRSHHCCFRAVWLLRHMPRKPMDAETGERGSGRKTFPLQISVLRLPMFPSASQYAMFLTLVFLAELIAGVSGFIFRHEVNHWNCGVVCVQLWNCLTCFESIRSRIKSARLTRAQFKRTTAKTTRAKQSTPSRKRLVLRLKRWIFIYFMKEIMQINEH